MEETYISLPQVIAIMTGFVIPLLVGLMSKLRAASWLKSVLNLGLSALSSLLGTVVADEFQLVPFLLVFVITWANSVASYYGLLKPSGISGKVQVSTAGFGLSA